MKALPIFFKLLGWDILREIRRRETIPNMLLFALLVLFVASVGVDRDSGVKISSSVGPVFFWVAILFAGTVGLSQSFAAEREGGVLGGIVTSPIDLGTFYLAKVAATTLYVVVLEIALLFVYGFFFSFVPASQLGGLIGAMSLFTVGYMGAGVVLAAMTTTLRGGGEVVLRILLVPLMIPFLWVILRQSGLFFQTEIAGGALGGPLRQSHFFTFCVALDAIYLTVGYLLFPKVLE